MALDALDFLTALAGNMHPEERMILCGFEGDPYTAGPTAWKPRPWRAGRDIVMPRHWNGYVTVASFGRAGDGSFRRRTETFQAGRALMVDDVGTKVDPATVSMVPPSWRIETSPGNEQWWYFLSEPETDMARFDGVIRAFISGKLLGADPGMSGVTRVGRLPDFVNGKPAHGGFIVNVKEATDIRYTTGELLDRFRLSLNGRRVVREQLATEVAITRNRAFEAIYRFLDQRAMLKRRQPDASGWTEITCPWVDDHTGGADTGAAVREPAEENDYYGSFRCHHGHCVDKGWAELTEWVNEEAAQSLDDANANSANYTPGSQAE